MPRKTGSYETTSVAGENVRPFVPCPLPPEKPRLAMSSGIQETLRNAETLLARLDAAGQMVPSVDWFVYAFVRKEAVISSQIEGTQASLTDLLTVEAEAVSASPREDVEEVCNYLDALTYARRELGRKSGLPLSVRLLNGAHKRLLSGTRGRSAQPGRIRRTQNWIGGTRPGNARFVPPPPDKVPNLLAELESYIHAKNDHPHLIRAGLIHAQFETIHPYLDGNGRVGRLLIALCLQDWGLLARPLLYLSLYFKRHQQEYYDRLSAVRTAGDWEGWIAYFLEGVATIAGEAADLVASLFELADADRRRLLQSPVASVMSLRLFDQLPKHPIITVKSGMKLCDTTRPTAAKAVDALCELGILEETSGKSRDRAFSYHAYLERLRVGTDLGDS